MKIKILFITFNRPRYTRLSLERLCESVPDNARITVWDNASAEETKDVIRAFEGHPAIERVIYNRTNDRLHGPTNWFWKNSGDADLLSKVDDDCLVPLKWCEVLRKAHAEIDHAGVLGCWRFPPEDLDVKNALRKLHGYGRHMIMRNCWIEGTGYLMKRAVIGRIGLMRPGETFTDYCIRAASKGFVNGWYYPFLYQEHMDDPRAEHTGIRTDEDFRRLLPLSAATFGIKTKDEWTARLRKSAHDLQLYSIDPFDYIGLIARIKSKVHSLFGKEYFPKAGE